MDRKEQQNFDVIVVGGGHAGVEASLASARRGAHTLLLTQNIDTLGQMSCNPAIGGIGKGHLVKEIEAMGGVMAVAADLAGIHYRTLNSSKGRAVQATRAQSDRNLYKTAIRQLLDEQLNLSLFQATIEQLLIKNNKVQGVITNAGISFYAKAVVLTVGTFLNGKIHVGNSNWQAGRAGDSAAVSLAENLQNIGFKTARLKTGTPPRIDGRTIDYSKLQEQPSEPGVSCFSVWEDPNNFANIPKISCYITRTNKNTQDIIINNLQQSALYSGQITGLGPRYCPSIEDKVARFASRDSHQVFLEPEGLTVREIYPNGISTSFPLAIQQKIINSIVGLETARITRAGYAIEYDFFDPRGLTSSLETKLLENLFFAGQINGTTGYEEAAAQGLVAGTNAAARALNLAIWEPKRHEAYIGVLIDDLVTRGTKEPYRMLTSRAEYRLQLREDNADFRLAAVAKELNLIDQHKWQKFVAKQQAITEEIKALQQAHKLELLRRPDVTYQSLVDKPKLEPRYWGVLESIVKYEGYLARQQLEIDRQSKHEKTLIPKDFNYNIIPSLSSEVIEKLNLVRPNNIGMAARIPGVTPAAISVLLIYLHKQQCLANC